MAKRKKPPASELLRLAWQSPGGQRRCLSALAAAVVLGLLLGAAGIDDSPLAYVALAVLVAIVVPVVLRPASREWSRRQGL